ncbi:nucleoporin 98-96 [Naegleria gruberi]|uniref:Nucleoporin 98-96 n=1 Tax=Naegleria gruberi TaxID=5762 RepID=D2V824_NAEGR|nr:nucleoporin 98-96 [Naegleria gruberi]EFC47103.1 nucleoporin 98-96 [Naegleria gruberi]|eukprot:XP_002679847.1 nucleoporin 98-96 [Naegleria gruberi strain NEG-M]
MFNFGGGTNTGGGFGAQPNTGGGGFGSTGTTGGTGFSFGTGGNTGGGFGAQPNTGGGGFGSTGTTQNTGFSFGSQPSTNTGGFGGMNNNTTGAFGQNKPFGTTGATNTGFGFGNTQTQPQQPQQQGNTFGASGNPFGGTTATNTGFGAPSTNTFGSTGTTTTTGGTGFSFGSQPSTGTTGAFGASNPFGGTTGTTTGTFGSTQPTTGTGFSFGSQPTQNTTGGGLFGAQPTQNTGMGFGATNTTGMGMGNTGGPITPQSFPSFKPTEENNTTTNSKMIYYSITKMDPYKDKSFEEWRWYFTLASQGKLTQNPFSTPTTGTTTGGFGQTTQPSTGFSFGNTGTTTTTTNTGFGTTGTMGGASNTGFGFGTQPTTQTGFGTTTNTGFGNTTTGGFGSTTSAFGNKPATTSTGFSFGSQPTTGTTGGLGFGSQPTTGTANTGFAFGSSNTGTANTTTGFGASQPSSGFNFGGGSTTLAPIGGTTNTGTTGSGFNFGGSTQPTTGATNTGSGFNFGGSTQPAQTSSGFNFGTGTSGFGATTGTTTTAPSTGFNFGGGGLGATGPGTTTGSGFNFGTTGGNTTGSSGFNFGGTTTQPLGGTSGFNFGGPTGVGLGMTTGFGAQPTNTGYGVAPMALQDLNNLLADPFGTNPLFQLQKEALEQSYAQEEESSVISKSIQKTSTQVRPRTFKKSSNSTLVDRMSLIASDTEPVTLDLLDSNSFTSKENVKELTISSAVFDKRSSQQLNQPRSTGTTIERDDSQKTISSNAIRPKPQKGKGISLDIEQAPKETTVKPSYLPKLTKEGYYTKPSFEQMKQMSQHDLQNCNGFTVGRKGYGEVEFLGVTDLTKNLDLDKIIYEIETHHVEVYSSNVYTERTKPPVGTELNKPTIIKLFNVHPKNNDYKQFERKLRKANEKSGSRFIDYETGQWTFKVEHFTKYGIFDDEEEEEIIEDEEEKQEPFQVVKKINLDEISDTSEDEIVDEEEVMDNDEEEGEDVMQIESHRTFLPRQLNLDPRRMYIMQANLMTDDEAADDNNIDFEAIRQTKKPRFKEISESEPTLAFIKKDAPIQQPTIKPRKYIDSTPSNIVGDAEAESDKRDSLFSLSRSFRVGFLPNGQFIVPTIVFNPKSKVSNISVSEFFVKEDKQVPQNQDEEYLKLKYESKVHLEIEHVERDPTDVHISLKNNSYTALMEGHVQKCEKIINSVDHYHFSDATKQLIVNREKFELSVWKLANLLFGDVDMLDGNNYATDIARKRNLSAWIREQIPIDEIINRANPKPLEKIYLLLSSGRIAEAARVALDNKDVRLSSIISQSFSNPFMQKDIQKQINLWKQAKANIEKDLIKIYELLAGNVCDTSLTWLQCLGLHLWYKSSPDTTISEVFSSYTNYFETFRATKPFLSSSRHSSETHYDLRYHILGMYCKKEIPISSSLEPSTYIDDILDCQLTWHLYNVLRRVTSCDTTGSMSHIITCNYALQLEQSGYPQYALFILCHCDLMPNISDDINRELNYQDKSNSLVSKFKRERLIDVRNRALREILFRNYPILMSNESGMKFISQLQISPNWIYEAAALYARYTCSYHLLFENLCLYHNYIEAHNVFLEYILSDLLLCNKYEELSKYVQKLYNHQDLIPNWSKGGDILYRYICVRKQFEDLEAHVEGNSTIFTESSNIKSTYDALCRLDIQITELLDLVKHLTLYTLEHRVAVSDTTVKITNMMVKVKSLLTVYEADTDYIGMIQEDRSNQKEQCLFNIASVTQNIYLTNQIDLLQTLALSTTFNLQ